jgi:hypothetical protein
MIHTNDEIGELIHDTIKLMLQIDSLVKNDHDCAYRTIYKSHRLLVDKILEELEQLTNEKVSIKHVNPRDLIQALEELKTQPKKYTSASNRLHKTIGVKDG